ncbi:MAG: MFS transporter [Miltoncostaeaceae bacterium]
MKDAEADNRRLGPSGRVLLISTVTFTIFFAVWVMFAIVGIPLRDELDLSAGQFALLLAVPILAGSVLRVPIGMLTDRFGGKHVMVWLLIATAIPTLAVSYVDGYWAILALSFFVGLAGTSFAVGVAWVSVWFPAERQGVALGTFGAGNVGASITKLLAPTLVTLVAAGGLLGGLIPGEWRFVPFIYGIALLVTAVWVWFASPQGDPKPAHGRTLAEMSRPLGVLRVWRFGLYYVVVFGAYVALSLWLPKYYVDVYDQSLVTAGVLTALFIFPASLLRPVGGWLSDLFGARRVTFAAFTGIGLGSVVLFFPVSIAPFTAVIVLIGFAMGIGKASVYKYVPDYFPNDVGAAGGLVGAIGGLGGFFLPLMFTAALKITGNPESTFYVLFAFVAVSIAWLAYVVHDLHLHEHEIHGAEREVTQ